MPLALTKILLGLSISNCTDKATFFLPFNVMATSFPKVKGVSFCSIWFPGEIYNGTWISSFYKQTAD